MINTLNTVNKSIYISSTSLERLINLFKSKIKFHTKSITYGQVYVIFPMSNIITDSTEAFQLDDEDVKFLYEKYKKKYKLELETKLKNI